MHGLSWALVEHLELKWKQVIPDQQIEFIGVRNTSQEHNNKDTNRLSVGCQ